MNTDKILSIPAEEYHAESRNGRYMSSHLLADFRESPELYRRKTTGQIEDTESTALAIGHAAHCLILEGRMAFDEQYLVSDGPVNARTNEPYGKTTKSYSDWLAAQTKGSPLLQGLRLHHQASEVRLDARRGDAAAGERQPRGRPPRRILRNPLPDTHGLVQPRIRPRRPQDLRQPEVVRERLPPLRIPLPDGILPCRHRIGAGRERPRPHHSSGEERAVLDRLCWSFSRVSSKRRSRSTRRLSPATGSASTPDTGRPATSRFVSSLRSDPNLVESHKRKVKRN